MNFKNLRETNEKLISYMESNNYCKEYIRCFRCEINWILEESANRNYESYEEVFVDRISRRPYSKSSIAMKKTIIGALKHFDLYGKYPDSRCGHCMLKAGPARVLSPEFQEFIDHYREKGILAGKKPGTLRSKASSTTTFFLALQERGEDSLGKITEDSVILFFQSRSNKKTNGYYFRSSIMSVLNAGMDLNRQECVRVIRLLPQLRPFRKNIQCFTEDEIKNIRRTLDKAGNGLSLRDRAIGITLMYTGLRSCDVAGLTLDSIDWERDMISIRQQKNQMPIELHLSPVVGNALYNYLTSERKDTGDPHVFLTENRPFNPLTVSSIDNVIDRILKTAQIRQSPGDRRGAHLFRHNVATQLMGKGIPGPVISGVLGHASPESLDSYLHADFKNLKQCALDIGCYPVAEGVFESA